MLLPVELWILHFWTLLKGAVTGLVLLSQLSYIIQQNNSIIIIQTSIQKKLYSPKASTVECWSMSPISTKVSMVCPSCSGWGSTKVLHRRYRLILYHGPFVHKNPCNPQSFICLQQRAYAQTVRLSQICYRPNLHDAASSWYLISRAAYLNILATCTIWYMQRTSKIQSLAIIE